MQDKNIHQCNRSEEGIQQRAETKIWEALKKSRWQNNTNDYYDEVYTKKHGILANGRA